MHAAISKIQYSIEFNKNYVYVVVAAQYTHTESVDCSGSPSYA